MFSGLKGSPFLLRAYLLSLWPNRPIFVCFSTWGGRKFQLSWKVPILEQGLFFLVGTLPVHGDVNLASLGGVPAVFISWQAWVVPERGNRSLFWLEPAVPLALSGITRAAGR